MLNRSNWRRALPAFGLAFALAGVQACGSNDNNNTGGTGTVAISLSPTQATVAQGGSTIVTGTITRGGGFTGSVNVTVSGTATGVTGTVNTTTGTGNSAQVTIAAASSATVGDDTLTVHVTGSGVTEATATFVLHVIASTGGSSFTFTSGPDSALTVIAGVGGTRALTFVRTNFTGAIALTAEGLPTGATAAFTTVGGTDNASVVTFTVPTSVAAGTYNVVLRATGPGVADATIPITLKVLASGTTGGFTVTSVDSVISIAAGVTGTKTLTFTRNGAFTGPIAVSAEGLPGGVTAAFGAIPTGNGTADVTFTVPSATATGIYNIVLRATSAGQPDAAIPVRLTVTAVGTNPSFSIAASPATVNMVQNNTATTSVNITRTNGFAGSVTFTATGAPTGLSPVFIPANATTGNSVQLSFTSTLALPIGTYPITVRATSAGITPTLDSAVVNVVVGTVAGSAVRLDYSACAVGARPIFVAIQDGTGAWTKVTGASDVYTFNITQSKGGVAVVTPSGAANNTSVFFGTQAELTAYVGSCAPAQTPGTVTGSVTGLNTADAAYVSIGGGTTVVVAPSSAYTINTTTGGTQDLIGYRRNNVTPGASDRGAIRRDQPSTGAQAALDFTGAESFAAATANITVSGAGAGDMLTQSMSYYTGAACVGHPLFSAVPVILANNVFLTYGVPATVQRPTDFHSLTLIDQQSSTSFLSVVTNFSTLAGRSVSLGAAVTATVTNITGVASYKRLQATGTLPADYATESLSYADASTGNSLTMISTMGYQGGAAFTLAAPDLSALSGFTATWEPSTGGNANFFFTGTSGGLTTGSFCTEGTKLKTGSFSGTM